MDRRRAYPWEDPVERPLSRQAGKVTVHPDGSRVTIKPDGRVRWEAAPQTQTAVRPPVSRVSPARPAPVPRVTQKAPVSSAPTPPAVPATDEVLRIFTYTSAEEVSTAARAVAEYAIKLALYLHGLQPSMIALRWMQRLAPGATLLYDGEFRGPHNMAGKTRSDGHDGRTVTIILRHDLPLETIAETALHESFHAMQFLHTPIGMRNDALKVQAEQQAQEFAARHLRDLQGVLASFLRPKRVCSRS